METVTSRKQNGTQKAKPARVIAISSGKGGVGKTSIAANLCLAMAEQGQRVLAMDADLGLANLDICFGVSPTLSLLDLFDGDANINEVLCKGADGVTLLPGCSGRYDLANLNESQRYSLFRAVDSVEDDFDALVLDTGAGIGSNAISFAAAASDVIIVANPEPTSLADAYAFIKVASEEFGIKNFQVIANMVLSAKEAEEVYQKLADLCGRFLNAGVNFLGYIPRDSAVSKAVRSGKPLLLAHPQSPASISIKRIANRILRMPQAKQESGGIQLFWRRVVGFKEAS